MQLIVEGWRFLPHSFSITNQFLLLEMLKKSSLQLFHQDIPYLEETWQPITGLFAPGVENLLRNIPYPTTDQADARLRITVPYNFTPSATHTCLFATTEWGILHNESFRVSGAKSLQEGHANSEIIIITPSQWSRDGFLRSGAIENRTIVIPCGVDPQIYHPISEIDKQTLRQELGWDDGFIFLNVGGITPNKGIDLLLKAFAIIVDQYPQARLVLKGSDLVYWSDSLISQYLDELSWEESEKVLPRLAYIGESLSFAKMAELYQAADVYVSPYLAEGFNLPVLEAIACGLPVICTHGGPTDDFIQPDFAWPIESKFQPGTSNDQPIFRLLPNFDHLISLMSQAIESSQFIQQAKIAGPAYVQNHFTWSHIVDRFLTVLTPATPSPHQFSQGLRLNLGCGAKILPNYINVDKYGNPPIRLDLETFPWPWPDNSVQEIQLIHVLEHLGKDAETYLKIIQEMYRICQPGAKIYIAVPHHRHDNFYHDPTHVRAITPVGLELFSQRLNQQWIAEGLPFSTLGLNLGVNFELINTEYKPSYLWHQLHPEPVAQEVFFQEANLYNNLIEEIRMILEVVK